MGFKPGKVGQTFKCIIDRIEGGHFVGRTEFDSPDVDNEVLIDSKTLCKDGRLCYDKNNNRSD
jgi:ribosomal protein S12 methylthiotransferase